MRWRYWSLLVSLSVLLHMALFWPAPDDVSRSVSQALLVRLPPSQVLAEPRQLLRGARDAQENAVPVEADVPKPAIVDQPPRQSVSGKSLERRGRSLSSDIAVQADQEAPPDMLKSGGRPDSPERTGSSVLLENEGAKAHSLSRYRIALAVAAVRMQALEAETAGMTGTAVVDVRLGGGGPKVHLATSSGVETLDRKALALLGRAVRVVPAPVGDTLSEASIRLPVVFSTDDS